MNRLLVPFSAVAIICVIWWRTTSGTWPLDRVAQSFAFSHFHMGHYRLATGSPEGAEASLRLAIQAAPKSYAALSQLGLSLMRQGRFDEATQCFRDSLVLEPAQAEPHVELANIDLQKNDSASAIQHYRAALQVEPNEISALNNLAWLLATTPRSSKEEGNESVKLAKNALQQAPDEPLVLLQTLAAAYAASGDFSNAIATAEKALAKATNEANQQLVNTLALHLERYRSGQDLRGN